MFEKGFFPYSGGMFGGKPGPQDADSKDVTDDPNTDQNDNNDNLDDDDDNVDVMELFSDSDNDDDTDDTSTNNNSNDQEPKFEDQWKEHLESLDFANGIELTDEQQQALQSGDMRPMMQAMNQIGVAVYNRAMQSASKVIESNLDKAVQRAVSESTSNVSADMSVAAMRKELPYLDNPIMVNQATELLNKALSKKGTDLPDAIQAVDTYFKRFAKGINGDTQSNDRPGSSRPRDVKTTRNQPTKKKQNADAWDSVFSS